MRRLTACVITWFAVSASLASAEGIENIKSAKATAVTTARKTSKLQGESAKSSQPLEAKRIAEANQQKANAHAPAKAERERRCAYLGYWGSFHITGDIGTAAYALGNAKYVADLAFEKEDNGHWYYRAGFGGDNFTSQWAFSRHPDGCGRYWVWRSDRGGWHRYEATRAWGDPLTTGSESVQVRAEKSVTQRLTDLEEDVSELKAKVNLPQATQP